MKVLMALVVGVSLVCAARSLTQEPPPKLNEEWLASDLARIEQLRGILEEPKLTIEGLKRALKSCDVREDRDIGFGSRCVYIAVYGGYTTTWVHVLGETRFGEHEARVAGVHFEQTGYPDSWGLIKERLRTAWGRTMRDLEFGFACERDDAKLTLELHKRTEDALGGHVDVQVPKELASAFELLTTPFESGCVCKAIGFDGEPSLGAKALQQLIDAERVDLLRAALRSLNPEGRVYAAHALIARGKLDPKDEAAIAKLRALDVDIDTADGCIAGHKKFTAALAVLD